MRTIEKKVWIIKATMNNTVPEVSADEPPDLQHCDAYIEGTAKFKVPTYTLKLVTRMVGQQKNTFKVHLVNDENNGSRLPYSAFMSLLSRLKSNRLSISHSCNWNLYTGQPVWEFEIDPKKLKDLIEEINIQIEVEIL